jgi:hypothetical protein
MKGTLPNKARSLPRIPTNNAVNFPKFLTIYGCSVVRKQKTNLKYYHTPISCTRNFKDTQSKFYFPIFLSCFWVQEVTGDASAQDRDGNDLWLEMGIRKLICTAMQVEFNAQWSMGSSHSTQNWNSTTTSLEKSATWNFVKIHRQCRCYNLRDGHSRFNRRFWRQQTGEKRETEREREKRKEKQKKKKVYQKSDASSFWDELILLMRFAVT